MPERKNMCIQRQIFIPSGRDISARLEAMTVHRAGGLPSGDPSGSPRVPYPVVASSVDAQAAQKPDDEDDNDEAEVKDDEKANFFEHQASDEATLLSQIPSDPPEIFKIPTYTYNDSGGELSKSQIRCHRRIRAMKRFQATKKLRIAEKERQRQHQALNADQGGDDKKIQTQAGKQLVKT
ncbi:hypothetical protein FHETE_9112 [Fusarium heterosporum]|uniref:Uncharacterized protein n=1 Tax=Fusarium heterosporum TaxID=42747 RepID=A0A8H5WJC9_FUSHE|nr:hypothetical protein FHETE_9112 [Fusarium heterosporum]